MTGLKIDWTYRYHLRHPLRVRMDRWRAMRRRWWLERGRGRSYGQVLRKRNHMLFQIVFFASYLMLGLASKLGRYIHELVWVGFAGAALFPIAVALRLKIDYDDGDITITLRQAKEGFVNLYDYYIAPRLTGRPYRPRYTDIHGRLSFRKGPEWVLCPGPHFRVRGKCWLRNGWSDVKWVKHIHINNLHGSLGSFIEQGNHWARPMFMDPGEVVGPGLMAA